MTKLPNSADRVLFVPEPDYNTPKCHISSMIHVIPEKVSAYKILEMASNRLIRVVFTAELEYETPRCHISIMSQITPEKGIRLQNKSWIFCRSLNIFDQRVSF